MFISHGITKLIGNSSVTQVMRDRDKGSSMDRDSLENVIKCVLSRFREVRVDRVHELTFLAEVENFENQEDRLTNAHFTPYLNGVYAPEIEEMLERLDGIKIQQFEFDGDTIRIIQFLDEMEYSLDDDVEEIVNEIVTEHGDKSPQEVANVLQKKRVYQETNIGDEIVFDSAKSDSKIIA